MIYLLLTIFLLFSIYVLNNSINKLKQKADKSEQKTELIWKRLTKLEEQCNVAYVELIGNEKEFRKQIRALEKQNDRSTK